MASTCTVGASSSIFQNDIESMNDPWKPSQNCEQDVDEEVSIAPSLEEDTEWWKDESEDDLDDV